MIPINKWSRPGTQRHDTLALVLHYPHWPMATAQMLYNYFAEGIQKEQRHASTQYVIGLDGELLQLMPDIEVAYHCGTSKPDPKSGKAYTDRARQIFGKYATDRSLSPNLVAVGVEICHKNRAGEMTGETIKSIIRFAVRFCRIYNYDPMVHIMRHQDVVGWKACPKYWCDHEDEWFAFLDQVKAAV